MRLRRTIRKTIKSAHDLSHTRTPRSHVPNRWGTANIHWAYTTGVTQTTDAPATTRYGVRTREFSWTRPTPLPPPPNIMLWRQHKARATRKSWRCFDYCPIVTPERFILMFSQVGSLKIDRCFYCYLIWPGNLYALTRNLFHYNCDLVFSTQVSIILNGRRDHRHVILIRKIGHWRRGSGGQRTKKTNRFF